MQPPALSLLKINKNVKLLSIPAFGLVKGMLCPSLSEFNRNNCSTGPLNLTKL